MLTTGPGIHFLGATQEALLSRGHPLWHVTAWLFSKLEDTRSVGLSGTTELGEAMHDSLGQLAENLGRTVFCKEVGVCGQDQELSRAR